MKILYIITTMGHGRGGHFYSLKTISEAMKNIGDIYIVNIGKNTSPVVESTDVKSTTIPFNGYDFVITLYKLRQLIKKIQPTVIHSFDLHANIFGKYASKVFNTPLIHTLCGGPNPVGYYPYIHDFILFSEENLKYITSLKKFQQSNIYLIPNRVSTINNDEVRINMIKKKLSSEKITLLRIARFGDSYKDSILQTINLHLLLIENNIKSQVVLIGVIENKMVYQEIIDYIIGNNIKDIHIFNDSIFTVNASEVIDIADCVIGTGRSFMEASSLSKIMFVPLSNSQYPALITKENFRDFFNINFSPRYQYTSADKKKNINLIIDVLENIDEQKEIKIFIKDSFERYFNIDSKIDHYKEIYIKSKFYSYSSLSNFGHSLRTIKKFIKGV